MLVLRTLVDTVCLTSLRITAQILYAYIFVFEPENHSRATKAGNHERLSPPSKKGREGEAATKTRAMVLSSFALI